MKTILIMICFAFPGGPGDECGISSVDTTPDNTRTTDENVTVFCTSARRALAASYPDAELTKCELWKGTPLYGSET